MQTNQVPARRRNPALQQGILFGVIFGIIILINDLLGDFSGLGATAGIISILLFLVELFLYAAAGFRASAQTGRVGTGTLAGIFAGLIGGIVGLIATIIIAFTATNLLLQRAQATANALHIHIIYTSTMIISSAFVSAILGLALAVGLGAAFGAIGGAIGRSRAPQSQAPYQEQFYQGMPAAPTNPANPYNQPYTPNGQGYPPNQTYPQSEQVYPQNPEYAPNNQENPYLYNQQPEPNPTNPTNPSNPYDQGNPPQPPSSNSY
ncbi:MAG TPA: hypothetical protein DHW02_06915 [Ktedonobacter sp.]|nr:hypothetical protein [Ktedonobacter sp.]